MLSRRSFLSPSFSSHLPKLPSPRPLSTSSNFHSLTSHHLSTTPYSLQNLNDEAARRLLELSKFDKDCADTIFWLRRNRHLFQMEIFEPAIVSLTVPDRRYASAVEACFSGSQLRVRRLLFLYSVLFLPSSPSSPVLPSVLTRN